MKRLDQFWCPWLGLYVIFIRQLGDLFLFEDFGDQRFLFSQEEVDRLVKHEIYR